MNWTPFDVIVCEPEVPLNVQVPEPVVVVIPAPHVKLPPTEKVAVAVDVFPVNPAKFMFPANALVLVLKAKMSLPAEILIDP